MPSFALRQTGRDKNNISTEPLALPTATTTYISFYLLASVLFVICLQAFLVGMLFFITPERTLQAAVAGPDDTTVSEYQILKLVNQARQGYQTEPLVIDSHLQQAAERKAEDMITRQYFSHTTPDGDSFSTWIKASGYRYTRAGENLAIFFDDDERVVSAWLASEKHRQNILNPYYQDTGIAVINGTFQNRKTNIIVQVFGQALPPNGLTREAF